MIICPNCKEEIEDDSHFCDQCGQALLYCNRCGRVGLGRRCTNCGGQMLTIDDLKSNANQQTAFSATSISSRLISKDYVSSAVSAAQQTGISQSPQQIEMPVLELNNDLLNIHIKGINGAIIGRRQGPYAQFFQNNMYISGVHAQLKYKANSGWCITDKHSSNGTKLNDHAMQPDVDMTIKNGDIIAIANVNLQVVLK